MDGQRIGKKRQKAVARRKKTRRATAICNSQPICNSQFNLRPPVKAGGFFMPANILELVSQKQQRLAE
jgi:hypothetical protein